MTISQATALAALVLGASNSVDPAAIADALRQMARLRAWETTEWRRLLHAAPTTSGRWESRADGPRFFLAANGRTDLAAEMVATIRAYFAPATLGDEHALCRFPARFVLLSSLLGLRPADLPKVECPGFEGYWRKAEADRVSLVFSSYYLNNPSSAFGHVFLRLDTDRAASSERADLLDQGIDFSADVGEENAINYAVKGIVGSFPGTFKLLPYYYKVREYGDFDSRDLWEYHLDLDAGQRTLLVAHLWELGSTYFDYYYLSENCAHEILATLEVANPRIRLTENLRWPVLPGDALQTLEENPGLVVGRRYVPSLRNQFRARLPILDEETRDMVEVLVDDPNAEIPKAWSKERTAGALDAAQDLVAYIDAKELLTGERGGRAHATQQRLLERRAALSVTTRPPRVQTPEHAPDTAHRSRRFGLAARLQEGGHYKATASGRLALHDLADAPMGFPELMAIEFLPFAVSWAPPTSGPQLDEAWFVRIMTLSPLRWFEMHPSWTARLGATRHDDVSAPPLQAEGLLAGGLSLATDDETMAVYLLGASGLRAPCSGGRFEAGCAGLGPLGGLRWRILESLVLHVSGEALFFPWQSKTLDVDLSGQLRWAFHRRLALELTAAGGTTVWTSTIGSLVYF